MHQGCKVSAFGFGPPPLSVRPMTDQEWATANAQAGRPASWRPGDDKPKPPPAIHPDRCKCCGRSVQWFATVAEWICTGCNTRPEPQPKPAGYVEPEPPKPEPLTLARLIALANPTTPKAETSERANLLEDM